MLSKRIMAEGVAAGYNVLLDGTGNSGIESLRKKVADLKANGAKLTAYYVTVDTDTAVKRSNARGKETGRYVPESLIRNSHKLVSQVVPQGIAEGLYDNFELYDTNSEGLKHVASAKGTKLTIHDKAAWKRFLKKGGDK